MEYKQFSSLSHRAKLKNLRKIVDKALKEYDLDIASVRFFAEHSNVLYSIQDSAGNRYMMKIARPGDHDYAEIRGALHWLHQANKAGVREIMEVIPTTSKELLVSVTLPFLKEPRFCSLYRWIPGKNFQSSISKKYAREWGALMANLHKFSSLNRPDKSSNALLVWDKVFYWDEEVLFSDEYKPIIDNHRRDILNRTINRIQAYLDTLWKSANPPMLIHADLHPDNLRIQEGRLYAIDFEDVMWGYPIQDIAIALLYVSSRKNYPSLLKSFREGYSSVLPWPVKDEYELWTLFAARMMMFANFVIKLKDYETSPDESLKRYISYFEEYLKKMPAN